MGILSDIKNKALGQFIDIIEWVDDTRNTLVWKFPRGDNEIKNGAQLVVRESQAAVFLHEGELGDVFNPGRVELTTNNIPILTTLKSWKYAFNSPFKCDVYFVTTRQFTDQKWGTQNPIMLRDPEFGPLRLRAFGTYAFKVTDPGKFIKEMAGTAPDLQSEEVSTQLRNVIAARFADALGEAKVPALDLASQYNELGAYLLNGKGADGFQGMNVELKNDYGIELTKFLIENISLPKEVEEALDTRTKMGVIGDMNKYTQFQAANALGDAAKNPGMAGNMMGMFAGVNLGQVLNGQTQAAQVAAAQPAAGAAVPPPLPGAVQWFAGINGAQQGPFTPDALKAQIAAGTITRDTLLWHAGMGGWTKAGDLAEVSGLFGAVPPPLPPM